jgi:hypothetical protein
MSVATQLAVSKFDAVLAPAWDLIAIHKRNPNQGLRVADLSLNRGAVVFAVAAWQTYVEQLTLAILDALAPPATDPGFGLYQLIAASIRERVKRLNVPDGGKTIDLLAAVDLTLDRRGRSSSIGSCSDLPRMDQSGIRPH